MNGMAQKDCCPRPGCGRVFKDLKAYMLTHQPERREKCLITSCVYHKKGFTHEYAKNRHTVAYYNGVMVCGFCPGTGSAAEKSFNRADVFERHLTSVHGVKETLPSNRKKSPTMIASKLTSYCQDVTGKCSLCSTIFGDAQDLYEHLENCILRVIIQEQLSETMDVQYLTALSEENPGKDTLKRHLLLDQLSVMNRRADAMKAESKMNEAERMYRRVLQGYENACGSRTHQFSPRLIVREISIPVRTG